MKRYIRPCVLGACYGFLPVILAWLLIRKLWAVWALAGKLLGIEPALALQVTQALQQLQTASLSLPWLMGVLLAVASVAGMLTIRRRKALVITGAVALLPLTLAAVCLCVVNQIRVWNALGALLIFAKAL